MAGLRDGIVESKDRTRIKFDKAQLSDDGLYGEANRALVKKMAEKLPEQGREQNLERLKRICVYECERAKVWLNEQNCDRLDFNAAKEAYHSEVAGDIEKAIYALKTIQEVDRNQPYYLRQSFAAGLLKQLSKNVGFDDTLPDANHQDGGASISISSDVREAVEPQFMMQAALWNFDVILSSTIDDLSQWHDRFDHPIHALGNLRFNPGLPRQSRSGISRTGDPNLGVATLCLAATLSCWFRRVTNKKFPGIFYDGDVYPKCATGPCWELVAKYVEAALPSSDAVTGESVKQRWHVIAKDREVRICRWPERGERQPQLRKSFD